MDQRTSSAELKTQLRAEAFIKRRGAWDKRGPEATEAILRAGLALAGGFKGPRTISGYFPIRDEIDLLPLLSALHEVGHPIALPVTQPGPSLIFRAWKPGSTLRRIKFGLREPGMECPEVQPEVLLVPLLGFDRKGNRLGYGAGYYDSGLRRLRKNGPLMAIGIAFDEQEFPDIPHDAQDERLDMILTPSRTLICGA